MAYPILIFWQDSIYFLMLFCKIKYVPNPTSMEELVVEQTYWLAIRIYNEC